MNDIDLMPPKCQNCPYWELADEPYNCNECGAKMVEPQEREDNNAEID